MSDEKRAWEELMDMEVIPPDELFSPHKASQGFYSKAKELKSFRVDASTKGVRGMFKSPIQFAKQLLKRREGTDWIVDQFILVVV